MSDIVIKPENSLQKVNPFEMFRHTEHEALEKNQGYEIYAQSAKTQGINLSTEYWSFNGADVQKAFNENPNIISDLENDLREAKDEKAKSKTMKELRKYKRDLIFKGLGKQEFLDEKTGELKVADVVYFWDVMAKKVITMGQARLVVEMQNIIKLVGGDPKSLIGNRFWVLYNGREQNKNNARMSDRFEVVSFSYAE